jgi:hypothetical protein
MQCFTYRDDICFTHFQFGEIDAKIFYARLSLKIHGITFLSCLLCPPRLRSTLRLLCCPPPCVWVSLGNLSSV